MNTYDLTSAARADLDKIEAFISKDSPDAAKRVATQLQAAMQRLADMPGMGHRRRDVRDDRVRFFAIYSYLIVYNLSTRPLQILRIVHGHRDVPRAIK